MRLSKNHIAIITIALVILYFPLFFMLPASIVGEDRQADPLLYAMKIAFFALTAAFITSFAITFFARRSFFQGQLFLFKKYRYYLGQLIKRDIANRYRKSILGVLWSVLNPLLTMIVLSFVFSFLFQNFRGGAGIEPNYPIYLLSGQLMFNFFSESTGMAISSIIGNEGVIRKVYIPKYVFPLSKMVTALVNFGFSFIAFLIIFIFTGVPFHWSMLLLPVPVIYLFVFSLGIAMFISAVAVFFRDLLMLYGVIVTLWMFLTPIMYPVLIIPPAFLPYYNLNPMVHFVDYFRCIMLWNSIPGLWNNMVCIAYALASFSIGTYVFMRRQNRFILSL